jgi:hypothetical protein
MKLARFFSYILHPLLMPVYAIALLFRFNPYLNYTISPVVQGLIYIIVFLTTFVMPVFTSLILLKKGSIRSLEMETTTERTVPFITTAGYYFICFWLLREIPIPRLFSILVLGAAVSIVFAYFINMQWKISIHMIGIGGIAGCFYALSQILVSDLFIPVIAIILLSGILGSSRLISSNHTPAQIYAGFFLGFTVEWVLLGIMQV